MRKRTTAGWIHNAIYFHLKQKSYTFTSFYKRDSAFERIELLWAAYQRQAEQQRRLCLDSKPSLALVSDALEKAGLSKRKSLLEDFVFPALTDSSSPLTQDPMDWKPVSLGWETKGWTLLLPLLVSLILFIANAYLLYKLAGLSSKLDLTQPIWDASRHWTHAAATVSQCPQGPLVHSVQDGLANLGSLVVETTLGSSA